MPRISAASSNENPAAPLSLTGLGLDNEKQGSPECQGREEFRYSNWLGSLDRLGRRLAMMVAGFRCFAVSAASGSTCVIELASMQTLLLGGSAPAVVPHLRGGRSVAHPPYFSPVLPSRVGRVVHVLSYGPVLPIFWTLRDVRSMSIDRRDPRYRFRPPRRSREATCWLSNPHKSFRNAAPGGPVPAASHVT